jgi:RNA recognition motif-containing protein
VIQEREARVDRASPPTGVNPPSSRLYFNGFVGDIEELREALGEFGEQAIDLFLRESFSLDYTPFTYASLVKDPSGVQTGAGFLEFRTIQLATEAIKALNGTALTPRSNFEITYARARKERPSRDGGERRGSFGFRGRDSEEGGYGNRSGSQGGRSWGGSRR